MDAKTNLKSSLPSRHATEGADRAPHRSFYYAMGLSAEQIHAPFVGVATCWNEAAPCNIALMRQAQAVKKGVACVGATPREFCTITVTDGIAMGHAGMKASLPSREVIADSVELTVRGHAYDALIGVAGCDKSQPGMMMAMCRLNVPSIYIYGGSILPGKFKGKDVTVQDVYEAVGRHSVGQMSDADLLNAGRERLSLGRRLRRAVHRQHHGDRVGSHRPGAALFVRRAGALRDARPVLHAGRRDDHGPDRQEHPARATSSPARRWRMPPPWLPPPAVPPMRALHLPAIAHECGIEFNLFDVAEVFKKTPYIADLKPSGRYVAKDMFEAGGVPLLMKTLLDHGFMHGDCLTVTGRTMAENMKSVKWNPDQDVVRPADKPLLADRRRRRPEGQSRARRRDREGRRHVGPQVHRPGALLRQLKKPASMR